MKRVAVVGSGISGLAVAHALATEARVTLFEAGDYFGGHTHTVAVELDGKRQGVDTGFLVLNERTYPKLIQLFADLGVETTASDMSFSVQVPQVGLEWSGSDLNSVFAQRRNLLRPAFLHMLADIVRFNKLATAIAERGAEVELAEPIGDFLERHAFGASFRDWYFLPMIGCIWSCPTDQMLQFPIATLIRFCHNHGLLQVPTARSGTPCAAVPGTTSTSCCSASPMRGCARLCWACSGCRRALAAPASSSPRATAANASTRW